MGHNTPLPVYGFLFTTMAAATIALYYYCGIFTVFPVFNISDGNEECFRKLKLCTVWKNGLSRSLYKPRVQRYHSNNDDDDDDNEAYDDDDDDDDDDEAYDDDDDDDDDDDGKFKNDT